MEIKGKTGATILMSQAEGLLLEKGISPSVNLTSTWLKKFFPFDKEMAVPPVVADIVVKNEFSLTNFGLDTRIILTPGHTSGFLSVIVPCL